MESPESHIPNRASRRSARASASVLSPSSDLPRHFGALKIKLAGSARYSLYETAGGLRRRSRERRGEALKHPGSARARSKFLFNCHEYFSPSRTTWNKRWDWILRTKTLLFEFLVMVRYDRREIPSRALFSLYRGRHYPELQRCRCVFLGRTEGKRKKKRNVAIIAVGFRVSLCNLSPAVASHRCFL